mgnify:CR=1 FL=1
MALDNLTAILTGLVQGGTDVATSFLTEGFKQKNKMKELAFNREAKLDELNVPVPEAAADQLGVPAGTYHEKLVGTLGAVRANQVRTDAVVKNRQALGAMKLDDLVGYRNSLNSSIKQMEKLMEVGLGYDKDQYAQFLSDLRFVDDKISKMGGTRPPGNKKPKPTEPDVVPPGMPKAKIRVSKGKEILDIDPADESSALAEGYKRVR